MHLPVVVIAAVLLAAAADGQAPVYPQRWVYVGGKLQSDAEVENIRSVARTASEHGLNGLMLNAELDRMEGRAPDYLRRVDEAAAIVRARGMEFIPLVFSAGYGNIGPLLSTNPNLAEGLPVKDALFVARGGEARLVAETPVKFEPVAATLIDSRAGVEREFAVRPYRAYRMKLRIKTEGFGPWRAFRAQPVGPDGRILGPGDPRLEPTADWHEVTLGFNSGGARTAKIVIGTASHTGKVWVEDLRVEEVGLLNVLRRTGTPVTVKGEGSGAVYQEGQDFARTSDPALDYRFDHAEPPIRLLAGTRIREGERLRVSFYHGMAINKGQVAACMSEPEVYAIWERNARLLQQRLHPNWWLISMDEVRHGGTCEACRRRNLSMAQILGDCITRQCRILRALNPQAKLATWSDMLDPHHNARRDFYLVDGDYTGSWKYVPNDLVILTWNYRTRAESLAFFSKLGFATLAAAYYDDPENPQGWLKVLDQTPGAIGIMYTTWQNNYELLPKFGDLVKPK